LANLHVLFSHKSSRKGSVLRDTAANENSLLWAIRSNACQFPERGPRTRYGHYVGELTAEQLARCFHLNDVDRELIAIRRGDHNRLGFALQLCTVRFLSTFLEDLQSIPAGVVNNVARQLAIDNPSCYAQYCAGEQRWEHAAEIRTRLRVSGLFCRARSVSLESLAVRTLLDGNRPAQRTFR
jgi:hypothetical protein